jgi:hypothetical protein
VLTDKVGVTGGAFVTFRVTLIVLGLPETLEAATVMVPL